MNNTEIEEIEIDLLLEGIFRRYGYDFRNYARTSIERQLKSLLDKTGYSRLSDMIPRLLHNRPFFFEIVGALSITVTEMFRGPGFYRALRENVIPYLQTYPFIKVWGAGCATGEEVYSLAIVLREEGLYDRATVFATDINEAALVRARKGMYSSDNTKQYGENYRQYKGKASFSDYCRAHDRSIIINPVLKPNITFTNHNLATDSSFGEMHLIVCRNVLIYFNKALQNRVLRLFHESLVRGGFLCLGENETLGFSEIEDAYEKIDEKESIYRKRPY